MTILFSFCAWWTLMSSSSYSGIVVPTARAFSPSSYQINSNINVNKNKNILSATWTSQHKIRHITRISLSNNENENDENVDDIATATTNNNAVWSPNLRRIMGGIAGLGALETGYLTYAKLFDNGAPTLFCGSQSTYSSCDQVLNGPYSNLPFFESVPLASLGFVAYLSVAVLALQPLLLSNDDTDDNSNRVLLTALTTSMGTFSIFLMSLLFGVLQTSCPYCIFSAACSFLLANLALIGGCLPEIAGPTAEASTAEAAVAATKNTTGPRTVAAGFAGAIVGAVLLFGTGSINSINDNGNSSSSSSTLLATTISGGTSSSSSSKLQSLYAPPEITTESSERALTLGKTLQEMDAKMYGAHWCSHCYDQKQILGKQVFDKKNGFVEYVECSKDGIQSQAKVCKTKEVPGYPTWEIQGKLYPGEQEIDELEDLVKELRSSSN